MENPRVLNRLYDAVDLLKLLEHIADGQTSNRASEAPWGGIKLILSQSRELIDAAADDVQAGDFDATTRPLTKSRRRDVESVANPMNEFTPERGAVRDLGESNQTGTFNRIQLPRDTASGEVL